MTEVQVDSTRVFVKGLPASLTSDQLATHFGKQYKVTDAHVFPERRIGFVGFHDTGSAQDAVKYFNRSYIRMSKISVDLARPVEVKQDASGQAVPVSQRNASHPTTGRRLRNEHPHQSDNKDSNKRKRNQNDDGELERAGTGTHGQTSGSHETQRAENNQEQGERVGTDTDPIDSMVAPVASDNDWLRGKTSRLLDLVGPDETAASGTVEDDTIHPDIDATEKPQSNTHEGAKHDEEDVKLRQIPNGRLFVRNLAFDVTDSDLEYRFGQFGKLQEVSMSRCLAQFPIFVMIS